MSKEVGNRIRSIRKELGLSMEDFGKLFSPPASKGVVSNWENGYNNPNNERLKKIAELGNVDTDFLLNGFRDLLGNQMSVGHLALFNYRIMENKLVIRADKQSNLRTMFIFFPIEIYSNSEKYISIIRATCTSHNELYDEIFVENCPHFFDVFRLDFSDKDYDSIFNTNDFRDKVIDINTFIHDKKRVQKDMPSNLFKSINEHMLNIVTPISEEAKTFFITSSNSFIKIYNLR